MVEVNVVDNEGYFLHQKTIEESSLPSVKYVTEDIPCGMLKPLWDGVEWVEGSDDVELDNLETIREKARMRRDRQIKRDEAREAILEKMVTEYLLSEDLTEEEKSLFINTYEEWERGTSYTKGQIITWDNVAYVVDIDHVSQDNWRPDRPTNLFKVFYQKETSDGTEVIHEFDPWKVYDTGAKVMYEGEVFVAQHDTISHSPNDYPQGWKRG